MNRSYAFALISLACLLLSPHGVTGQTRQEKILKDRDKVLADGFWIYNDLDRGIELARDKNLPLLVTLRCLPCEECVKLDEELIERHAEVQPLLEKFVRVRLITTNNLDLNLFQFDTDQSFAVFFLNADGTIYGRFGTRSDQIQWADDVSIEGLARAMEGALELHAGYPANKPSLVAKRGPRPEFAVPQDFPLHKGKFGPRLDYEGNVVKSCIHCHMIGDAARQLVRDREGKLPENLLYPFPHPKTVGLTLDPKSRATVLAVEPNSPAASAGLEPGDRILTLEGQPPLSIADVQWVLHQADSDLALLKFVVRRGEESRTLTMTLNRGWRRLDDIAWRASSWGLRRMGLGGAYFKTLDEDQRTALRLDANRQGLYVAHVGLYSPHDQAHKAGLKKGDVLLKFAGREFQRESDLLRHALNEIRVGDSVTLVVERQGEPLEIKLQMAR